MATTMTRYGVPLLDIAQRAGMRPELLDVIEYRKSGLSVNWIVGCPLDCGYCVRHLFDNFEMKVPRALMDDEQAADLLCSHRYFRPHITPIQLLNRATDPMLPRVKQHTLNMLKLLDARRIAAVSELAVNHALSDGPCVIVGRGSQYFLRERQDVFRAFLYASRTSKIHRLITAGTPQEKAITDVDTIDRDRAAFVKTYFKLNWPEIHLYDAMFNTEMGESCTATMLVECLQLFQRG